MDKNLAVILLMLFIPVFPFSMLFNLLEQRITSPLLKGAFMLAWLQAGILLLDFHGHAVPEWMPVLATGSALLYVFRSLVVNDLTTWAAYMFMVVSGLIWLLPDGYRSGLNGHLTALALAAPLLVLEVNAMALKARYRTVHLNLASGLALHYPMIAGSIVLSVMALTGVPPFPHFAALIHALIVAELPVIPGLMLAWFLLAWSGVRLLQKMVMGRGRAAMAVSAVGGEDTGLPLLMVHVLMHAVVAVMGFVLLLSVVKEMP